MTPSTTNTLQGKTALVTGGGKRIGAAICRQLHDAGMNVIIHYRHNAGSAASLADDLNRLRPGSATTCQADFDRFDAYRDLMQQAEDAWQGLDVLVNNASSFFPTPLGSITEQNWNDLLNSNLKAPLFLSQAAQAALETSRGCIVNLVDVHAQRPMREHPVYCAAKAGLAMLTYSLAKEMGPAVRVNGVAPGAILWPENGLDDAVRQTILARTALQRTGTPEDIARAVLFLVRDADYITGHILPVDGGRLLNI